MKKRRQFTPEFKAQLVQDVLTGVQSQAEACRKNGRTCMTGSGFIRRWAT